MNTKTEKDQKKNQRQQIRQDQGPKKQGRNLNMMSGNHKHQDHDQEHPETRLTR